MASTRRQVADKDDNFVKADSVSQASSENVNSSNSGKLKDQMTPDKR